MWEKWMKQRNEIKPDTTRFDKTETAGSAGRGRLLRERTPDALWEVLAFEGQYFTRRKGWNIRDPGQRDVCQPERKSVTRASILVAYKKAGLAA